MTKRFPIRLTKQSTTIISIKEAHLNQSESEVQKLKSGQRYTKKIENKEKVGLVILIF